jgi:hypothetical protein
MFALAASFGLAFAPAADAQAPAKKAVAAPGKCIKAGGEGNGALEGFARFMAEAAMKNSAKAWGGDAVKITAIKTTCDSGLITVCRSFGKACK